jgi:hypothetical protein
MARASSDPDWRDSGNHRKANSGDDDFPVNQGNTVLMQFEVDL